MMNCVVLSVTATLDQVVRSMEKQFTGTVTRTDTRRRQGLVGPKELSRHMTFLGKT